ncbi:hypothetical protein VNI00_003660 [Paramarasmius palmivorus]|uniref:Uncharacterized protein n=1 Tax=Paramarasmius palmivorus TaxID=297713 RepID=A0AAW0DUB1_9AGAR
MAPRAKDRPMRRLPPEILYDNILSVAIRDTAWKSRAHLLLLDRESFSELQPKILGDVIVSRKRSLVALLELIHNDEEKAALIHSLHIQIGCLPATVPRVNTRRTGAEGRDPCNFVTPEFEGECDHICQRDHTDIKLLLEACGRTVRKLVIHCNDTFIPLTNFMRHAAFPSVTEAEVPAETVCFAHNDETPFPAVERLTLSCVGGMYSSEVVTNMDLRRYQKLEQVVMGFWKTEGRLVSEAVLRLRVTRRVKSFAIEQERGMHLPTHISVLRQWCRKPWLLVLMTTSGMEAEMGQWKLYFRYGDVGGLTREVAHEEAKKLIMMFPERYEWDDMAKHAAERRGLAEAHNLTIDYQY